MSNNVATTSFLQRPICTTIPSNNNMVALLGERTYIIFVQQAFQTAVTIIENQLTSTSLLIKNPHSQKYRLSQISEQATTLFKKKIQTVCSIYTSSQLPDQNETLCQAIQKLSKKKVRSLFLQAAALANLRFINVILQERLQALKPLTFKKAFLTAIQEGSVDIVQSLLPKISVQIPDKVNNTKRAITGSDLAIALEKTKNNNYSQAIQEIIKALLQNPNNYSLLYDTLLKISSPEILKNCRKGISSSIQ